MDIQKFVKLGSHLLDVVYDGIIIANKQGLLIYANDANSRITGLVKEEIIGKPIVTDSNLKRVLDTGEPLIGVTTKINSRMVISNIVPLRDENDRLVGAISIFRDLSETMLLHQKLSEANNAIRELSNKLAVVNMELNDDMVIGNSPAMRNVVSIALKAAQVDSVVIIEGESGTGKEMLARFIHMHSGRADKPFLAVNCSAIPETLMESELFGYEEGAFSGALRGGKPGMFELAAGGTLFLDEIEDFSPAIQAKLLRIFQSKEVMRVGGVRSKAIDTRIIGASNCHLEQLVKEKRLREDLYYRLSVVKMVVPPLRERREDIPLLITRIIDKLSCKLKKKISQVHQDVVRILLQYSFPGNIRELENILEFAIIMDDNQILEAADLAHYFNCHSENIKKEVEETPIMSLAAVEADLIQRAIRKYPNKLEAAKVLGICRASLYRKMKEYEIS